MEISLVRQHLEQVTTFLGPLLPLANCHMVDFFTKSTYQNHIPENIQLEIEEHGLENTIRSIFGDNYTNLPVFKKYVEKTKYLSLSNCSHVCLKEKHFINKLKLWGCEDIDGLKLNRFMTSKKSHEVEILSPVVAAVNHVGEVSHLIDIGDGKGYLSSMLAFHHNLKVLGVDAVHINTDGAIKRATRLSKQWKGLTEKAEVKLDSPINNADNRLNLYKQITQFVDQETNFMQLVKNIFLENPTSLGIVGLHTCGNLGPSSVKVFDTSEHVKTICNVSCCYHLLTEKFECVSELEKSINCAEYGFPLSTFLEEKRFALGRRARMVSAQSIDRILHKKELPSIHILYRAIFQVILEDNCTELPTKRVGKVKKCDNFVDYTRRAFDILELEVNLSDNEIINYFTKYKDRVTQLHAFYLVRSMLSPVIESVILLDRLLFLLERGHTDAFLVHLFDPVISPRCYGLICVKKFAS